MTQHDMAMTSSGNPKKLPSPDPIKQPIPLIINEDGNVYVVSGTPKKVITIDGETYHIFDLEALDHHKNMAEFLGV